MALVYTVREMNESREMQFIGESERMTIEWQTMYQVLVSDDGGASVDPQTISPLDIITAPGLPQVNRTVYYFNGKIIPFVVCKNKVATMDTQHRLLWTVTCTWRTLEDSSNNESDDLGEQEPPATLTDITPIVELSFEETQRVIYADFSGGNQQPAGEPILTPTGNLWSKPTHEKLAMQVLRITQYESFVWFDTLQARMFKLNQNTYRGKTQGTWMITGIEPTDATVQLAGGPVQAAQVTYTIKHNPAVDNSGTPSGWIEQRALIDTHYFDGNGDKQPFLDDENNTETVGFVDIAGNKKPGGTLLPDYKEIQSQPLIDFNSFLQA